MIHSLEACLRKRPMTRIEAKAQMTARLASDPTRPIKIYLCPHCHMYHTATDKNLVIRKSVWRKIKR